MERILISACLVGDNVKYDGGNNKNPLISQLLEKYELVPFCPEDVSDEFYRGADLALNICLYLKITKAILKERSPSCGVHSIYDGTFSHKVIPGMGVTAALLKRKGITVYSEDEIPELLNLD